MAIDRRSLVRRNSPRVAGPHFESPFSVGNGDLVFTADSTGFQTLYEACEAMLPLCTQSSWGWHSFPDMDAADARRRLKPTLYDTHGRLVGYDVKDDGQQEAYRFLRQNPHRLNLGRVALIQQGEPIGPDRIEGCEQELDLWGGLIASRFELDGRALETVVACHPGRDILGFRVSGAEGALRDLAVELRFPYGSPEMSASDWSSEARHRTSVVAKEPRGVALLRRLDSAEYHVGIRWSEGARWSRLGPHRFAVGPAEGSRSLELSIEFAPASPRGLPMETEAIFEESRRYWAAFWSSGGCVELTKSRAAGAAELERCVVLSQYQLAINSAGSYPPAETGLVCNSWYGKFHLEMHPWHSAWMPLWGRPELLERSLWWYRKVADIARGTARRQGYLGLRWQKMTDPSGLDSPSPIAPLLIWQQPHLLSMLEYLYRNRPDLDLLAEWSDLVFEAADFMADFAFRNPQSGSFELGPPLIPAQENHPPELTCNPTYELEYWRWGLETALEWRRRLGLPPVEKWREVADGLAPLPVQGGLYLAHERCPDTYGKFATDHPSMVAALGLLPGAKADPAVMSRTLDAVLERWDFESCWGWDFPMLAMTAARLGRPEDAVSLLLMDRPKNSYLANGHNPQRPRGDLPLYLPGNGALLLAVSMMAAGWDGAPKVKNPGFPRGWEVEAEGLSPIP
jgi:hypothetical protein